MSVLSQDVRIGQNSVEDKVADADQVAQIWDWQNLTENRLQSNMKPKYNKFG